MAVHLHPNAFQMLLEMHRGPLLLPAGHHHAAHIQADAPEGIDQAQHVGVVGDAQVAPHLAFFDVVGVDGDHQLRLVLQIQQHGHFAVRPEARQHAGSVIVVKQLAAQLQVQLASKFVDPLPDMLRLHGCVFVMIKTDAHGCSPPSTFFAHTRIL